MSSDITKPSTSVYNIPETAEASPFDASQTSVSGIYGQNMNTPWKGRSFGARRRTVKNCQPATEKSKSFMNRTDSYGPEDSEYTLDTTANCQCKELFELLEKYWQECPNLAQKLGGRKLV